jgi:hypothetical protein
LAAEIVLSKFNATMRTISQLDIHDDLAVGFKTFKRRGRDRYVESARVSLAVLLGPLRCVPVGTVSARAF